MTNTKFRKRALLSSVAMLLVALVALGSATFAWFTNDPTANASGLKIKATTSEGLVIITQSANTTASKVFSADGNWVHTDYLNCDSNRAAQSTNYATSAASWNLKGKATGEEGQAKFYTVVAAEDDDSAADTTKAVFAATGLYDEKIYMRATGQSADARAVKISSVVVNKAFTSDDANATALAKSLRVVLLFSADGAESSEKVLGEYGINGFDNNVAHITYVKTPGTTLYGSTATTEVEGVAVNDFQKANASAAVTDIAALTNSGIGNCQTDHRNDKGKVTPSYLRVVIFFDGESTNCKTTNTIDVASILSGFQVNLALA